MVLVVLALVASASLFLVALLLKVLGDVSWYMILFSLPMILLPRTASSSASHWLRSLVIIAATSTTVALEALVLISVFSSSSSSIRTLVVRIDKIFCLDLTFLCFCLIDCALLRFINP